MWRRPSSRTNLPLLINGELLNQTSLNLCKFRTISSKPITHARKLSKILKHSNWKTIIESSSGTLSILNQQLIQSLLRRNQEEEKARQNWSKNHCLLIVRNHCWRLAKCFDAGNSRLMKTCLITVAGISQALTLLSMLKSALSFFNFQLPLKNFGHWPADIGLHVVARFKSYVREKN